MVNQEKLAFPSQPTGSPPGWETPVIRDEWGLTWDNNFNNFDVKEVG